MKPFDFVNESGLFDVIIIKEDLKKAQFEIICWQREKSTASFPVLTVHALFVDLSLILSVSVNKIYPFAY